MRRPFALQHRPSSPWSAILRQAALAPEPDCMPQPQRGLQRPCGCDTDVTVFGHVVCPDAGGVQEARL